jgi:hypothetical protein
VTEPPILRTFEVACPIDHAFRVWTEKLDLWWPKSSHSISGEAVELVAIEPTIGGRIFERAADGTEHEWGRVTAWAPPTRFAYLWFIGHDPSEASEVDVSFAPIDLERTRVSIVQKGWERSGPKAKSRRRGNAWGWDGVVPAFVAHCDAWAPAQRS